MIVESKTVNRFRMGHGMSRIPWSFLLARKHRDSMRGQMEPQISAVKPAKLALAVLALVLLVFASLNSDGTPQAQAAANTPPVFADDRAIRSVPENSPPGTNVGEPVTATDAENESLTYSISGTDASLFDIESGSGQITVGTGTVLDFETRFSYTVTVTAADPYGAVDSITVIITVTDLTVGSSYDADNNESIERDEVIAAIVDYFSDLITREETIEVIKLYFSPTVAPAPAPRIMEVSSGRFHTCALLEDGSPVCWGAGASARQADDSSIELGQALPPEDERFKSISSGAFHTCGLRENGTVACWGAELGDRVDIYGEVGFGQSDPPTGEVFVQISSGGGHTCALREDGTPVCWGSDSKGQSSPPEGEQLTQIASGGNHTCGLREDGTAVCWGPEPYSSFYGGWDETPDDQFVFLDAASGYTCGLREGGSPICWGGWSDVVFSGQYPISGQRLTTISADGYNGCGLWTNGTLSCWGYSRGTHPLSQKFAAVSSGPTHTCAIRKDDKHLVCWGQDQYGQSSSPIGDRFVGPELKPERPSAPDVPLVSITSGNEHACGLDNDGVVHCWGNNDYQRSSPPAGELFLSVSAGDDHTCGVRQDGSIACWGKDDFGQASPPEGETFVAVSSGRYLTCGLRQDGLGVCWGSGEDEDELPPVGEQFTTISAGTFHACGLRQDGSPVCWGGGSLGQNPPSGETLTAISNGTSHACALRADGVPICWGSDGAGQSSPPDGERLVTISSGDRHTCGLRADGMPVCWGAAGQWAGSGAGISSAGRTVR